MTPGRDPLFKMLDLATADRILDGAIAVPDAPPGYERAVALLATLAELPASPNQPVAGTVVTPPQTRRSMRSTRRRVALIAMAVAMVIPATAGVAYANILPDSVGHSLVHLMHRVGLPTPPDQERNDPQPAAAKVSQPPARTTRSTVETTSNHTGTRPSANPTEKTTSSGSTAAADTDPPPSSISQPAPPPASTTDGAPLPVVPTPHTRPTLPVRATDRPTPPATEPRVSRRTPQPTTQT